ncbi:TadE/TadG family type IV pilus assembly protein [Aminobacter sp. AP02]|uniref:TadE/TadG family type IV pilus assembly protein n=1 Tax=Aminobacter sp. AP02 TaxID=2135737 RepID=UPI000D6BCAF6|nr:TadE/TadG family type IV pilus assembly protein [Aminobacter sp. AP02]PWK68374.1 Flp pilus assembly protein TadG [Aminobacter sp. AP02]
MLGWWQSKVRALVGDNSGIAAVEFALIAPLVFSFYFVTMEVSQAIETSKKVSRVGSMVADLITQQQRIDAAEVDAVMKIGESMLQPYSRSVGKIVVTAIEITNDATPRAQVLWSRKLVDGVAKPDLVKGTATTVPAALRVAGSFLIRVESELDYKPVLTWAAENKPVLGLAAAFDGISMGETYYLRPRMSQTIPCTGCEV